MKTLIKKFLNRETIIYTIFGVLTTAVNYISYWLLRSRLGIPFLIANTIAWIISVLFAFITNKLVVFESRSFKFRLLLFELVSFVGARILSFLFEEGFLAVTTHFNVNEYLSKAIAGIIVIIINYFLSKFFIFKKKNNSSEVYNGKE